MKILVDGHNLIFECGLHGKRINPLSLAKARQRLLQQIAESFDPAVRSETTVVFDSHQSPATGQPARELFQGIEVLYASEFPEADDLIEHLIAQHSAPKQLTMVSSDHRLHKAALRRRAHPIDSDVWYDALPCMITDKPHEALPALDSKSQTEPGCDSSLLLTDEDISIFKNWQEE